MIARDEGLQAERTVLAWQRTGLALVVAAAVISRVALPTLGGVPALLAGTIAALVAGLALSSVRRSVLTGRPIEQAPLTDGRTPAVVAALAGGLALVELVASTLH